MAGHGLQRGDVVLVPFPYSLLTLDPALVRHRLGRLTPRDLREVDKKLRLALEL